MGYGIGKGGSKGQAGNGSGTALAPSGDPLMTTSTEKIEYDAVIIGAGWAGLRAAQILSEAGVGSVLILDAENQPGGRSRSVVTEGFPNVPTDLGSEWLFREYSGQGAYLEGVGLINDYSKTDSVDTNSEWGLTYLQTADGSAEVWKEGDQLGMELWRDFLTFKKNLLKALGDVTYARESSTL